MPKNATRKPSWPLWLLTALALLLLLYAIAGFLLLPWWLEQKLPEQAQRHLGWQVDTAGLSTNPFALSLTLNDLTAADSAGNAVADIQKLHLDLSFFKLFMGQIRIDQLDLEQPYLRLRLDQDGQLNLLRDWRDHSPQADDTARVEGDGPDADAGLPLIIGSASVQRGNILLQDHRTPEHREFKLSPLQFELQGATFNADSNEAGRYQLSAVLGDDQRLNWQGQIDLMPLRSSGVIALENIRAEALWHFVGRYAAYDWRQGRIDLKSNYQIDNQNRFQVMLDSGRLEVRDSQLYLDPAAEEPVLAISRLNAEGMRLDWLQSRLQVDDVSIDNWTLAVARNASGQLEWAAALESLGDDIRDNTQSQSQTQTEPSTAGGTLYSWNIQHLGATQGRLRWRDASLAATAELGLEDIEIDLNGLTNDVDQPVDLALQASDGQGGRGRLDGEFTVVPFTLEAGLQLTEVSLVQLQPYLSEYLQLSLDSGSAGFDGRISLDDQQPELTGSLGGNLSISSLSSRLATLDEPFLSWDNLRMEPLQVSLKPLAVDVRTVTVQGAELTYLRLPGNGSNFDRLFPDRAGEGSADQAGQIAGATPAMRIERLNLDNAAITLVDRVIPGGFRTRLQQIGGDIVGISNRKPQRGEVNLQGQVGEQGSLKVEGSIGALGETDTSELKLITSNLDMTALEPYVARYLGYRVREGVLDLAMDYTLEGQQLSGSNDIVLQNFTLGDKVQSSAATDVPVKAGLALLRGPGGAIDIDLPISGDLGDPQFSFSNVIFSAFSNLVTRAATAPFSVIASLAGLAGFDGEDLGEVGFIAGTASLAPTEADKLKALAEALQDRPGISLRYRGATAPGWDRPALVLAAESFTLPGADLEAQSRALEARLASAQGEAALTQRIENFEGSAEQRRRSPDWVQSLLQALAGERSPAAGALRELAEQRAGVLRQALIARNIDPARLSAADTRNNAAFSAGRVMIPLEIVSAND